uniref:hypothetical protein n=1 Tax=Nonomuraea bangladeshensis TaxID=404385 RepID=UPI003F4953D4
MTHGGPMGEEDRDRTEDTDSGQTLEVFPVAIGHYTDPALPDLDVDSQVGRLLDLLAPFGAWHQRWAWPARQRGAGAVERRLLAWRHPAAEGTQVPGSLLYWVGHGWSDGTRATLAHTDSPATVAMAGVTPDQVADAVRAHQALISPEEDDDSGGWAMVVIDTCRSARFVELLNAALSSYDPPERVLLVGVSGSGSTSLGRFTDALRTVLVDTFRANRRIRLTELANQLPRLLPGARVYQHGLIEASLVPTDLPVASWMSAPLDEVRHLEEVLDGLTPDARRHFLAKAQGAEHGELSWFFEGREQERSRIVDWLRCADSGMLVVTGRAGSGKSALLGNVLVHSLPELRQALARRGLLRALDPVQLPPDGVFDAAIHLSGLTLSQVVARVARAGLGALPSWSDPAAGVATDLDWLADRLAEWPEPFTVLVDALDEATDPLEIARSLLARIAALPGVRVLVGTRASTNEAPDAPARDDNLLQALAVAPSVVHPDTADGGDNRVWVTREREAIRRYVGRRLREARDHGVAGVAVPGFERVTDDDLERVAAAVARRDRQFLFARLAVYELIEDPWLLTRGRAQSLEDLLDGDHQDLFAKALDRLARHNDRYPILLRALSLARGRGLPEADGVWAAVTAALTPRPRRQVVDDHDEEDLTDEGVSWSTAVHGLLNQAAAYVIVDTQTAGMHRAPAAGAGAPAQPTDDGAADGKADGQTVYRLAHRTFVEHFTDVGHPNDTDTGRQRLAATALLDLAARIAADDPAGVPGYLAQHLSGHVADADIWDDLAEHPQVLDELDPAAVTADALRSLFVRRPVPPPVAGVIGARDALLEAARSDRAGLRQLATTTHSSRQRVDEPTAGWWGVAAAQAGHVTMHVRLPGHTALVRQVCGFVLPGGRTALASAGDDGTVRLWNPENVTPIGAPLTGHTGTIEDICAVTLANGRVMLASAGADGTVRMWDPATGRPVGTPITGHASSIWGVCALPAPDGSGRALLASAGADGTVRVWDPATGEPVGNPMTGHSGPVTGVCALPDPGGSGGALLASTGYDGMVRMWDPATGQPVGTPLTGHSGPVLRVCALPDRGGSGRALLASAGADGTVRVWDPATGRPVGTPLTGHTSSVRAVCALPDPGGSGRALLVSAGDDGMVRMWDPATGRPVGTPLTGHTSPIWGVCALPDPDGSGRALLASAGADGAVRMWDPTIGRPVGDPPTGRTSSVRGVCALPDPDGSGRALLASAMADGTVRMWDPATGRPVGTPLTGHVGPVRGVCALPAPDGTGRTLLASAGYDGTVRVWDPATGRPVGTPLTGHIGPIWGVCVLPDPDGSGRALLASAGSDGTVRMWDPATSQPVGTPLTGHIGPATGVCALPDPDDSGRALLASAGDDGTVRVWDPATGRPVGDPMTGHSGPAIWVCAVSAPDGSGRALLASTGGDGTVRVWDPATGRPVGTLRGHASSILWVCALPAPDGSGRALLASAGSDGTVRMWDPATCRAVGTPLTGHSGPIRAVCALPVPDGTGRALLASAGDDGTVRVWDPATSRLVGAPLGGAPDAAEALTQSPTHVTDQVVLRGDSLLSTWTPSTSRLATTPGTQRASAVASLTGTDHPVLLIGDTSGQVHITDPATAAHLAPPIRIDTGAVLALQPLPGTPARVATGGRDGVITTWTISTAEPAGPPLHGHEGPVRALCLVHRDGSSPLLASAGNDGTIRLWDVATWTQHGEPLIGHRGWVWALAPVPGGSGQTPKLASAGADGTVRLWDPLGHRHTGERLTGHTDQVRAVAVATCGDGSSLLVSGSQDGTVRLWRPMTGEPVHTIPLGIPVHALLQQAPDDRARERTGDGATITVGLRTGVLALDLHRTLFGTREDRTRIQRSA